MPETYADIVLGYERTSSPNCQEKGDTVNSLRYSIMMEDKLKIAIRNRCRGLLSKGVLLPHDNVQPHTAAATVTNIQELKFETIPDLAPSDYHMFGTLKDAL
jgi:hypothetical protein